MTRKRCTTCKRSERHFDGCSHIDCPNRATYTAQLVGDNFFTRATGVENQAIVAGGVRRQANIKDYE